ncbi:MAG TPA: CvpA family protein, partial [Microterricola sp.]
MTSSLILDIVVGLILLSAAVSGWRTGLFRSAFGALGLIAGGVAAYLLLPQISAWAPAPEWRAAIVIGGGVLLLILGNALGSLVGGLLSRGMRVIKLSVLDRLAGLAVSTVVTALVLGTVAGGVSSMGVPPVTQTIAGSATLGTIDRLTPD